MEAFVYCWTNAGNDRVYVGCRKGHPQDGYICSSKSMLEDYSHTPSAFSRQIVATGTYDDMRRLETAILVAADARNSSDFYNMHNNTGDFRLKQHTTETRAAISRAAIGRRRPDVAARNRLGHTDATRMRIGSRSYAAGIEHVNFGKRMTEEQKQKISAAKKLNPRMVTEEIRQRCVELGKRPKTAETRAKMSAAAKLREARKKQDVR